MRYVETLWWAAVVLASVGWVAVSKLGYVVVP